MRLHLLYCVFFVPIFSILLGGDTSRVSGQCLADQRDLLTRLKNSLTFNATLAKKLNRWGPGSDCCQWGGVNCDAAGRVIGLDLSEESISGGIEDSSLFNLKHLNSLDLSLNNFNSTVPPRIGNLRSLTHLNLSNAGFREQIPKEISMLTSLVSLDISDPGLWKMSSLRLESPNLGMLIKNLSRLEELYLAGVNISAPGREWGHDLSSSLPRLRVLSLSNCFLSGPIDSSLGELRSLSVIHLHSNNLSSTVPGFFSNFSNLTSLRLASCGLFGTFPREIFLQPALQEIDISINQGLGGSLPDFKSGTALQKLVLRFTNFSGEFQSSIGNLENLSILDLSNCRFSGTVPRTTAELSRLVFVDLSVNNFSGPVPSFEMSRDLTQVVLSHNSFSGAITSVRWQNLKRLVVLDLRNNLLNGSIPSSLFDLPSLEQLRFSNNQFEGELPELQNASSSPLDTLDLSSNNLRGHIPMSIFGLEKLSILSLSSNNLTGTVHLNRIPGLSNLTTLDLSYNNLSIVEGHNSSRWSFFPKLTTLKFASCKLKKFPNLKNHLKLVTLDLSNNQIHGEVPSWIWEIGSGFLFSLNLSCNSLVSLQEPYTLPVYLNLLDLHKNQIHGNIPTLPSGASYIDFSNNNFSSAIPSHTFEKLIFPIFLSISNNNLTGVIPESICNAASLQVLDFSNNRLSGWIPACIPAMIKTLRVLNLERNHLTGPIPDSFPEGCGLKTLDLNGNSIEGQVPNSLVNCTELEVLNLGNNIMSDKFPCMLKNISTLKVLVLRSNRFHGGIGCGHGSSGKWKKLQIVDLAHNNFGGELPAKCLEKWEAMHADEDGSERNHVQFEVLQFSNLYYQDSVTITIKGLELEFVKILTVFTSIDLSSNNLTGKIPEHVGILSALYVLNLSHNALTGEIPPSIGKLSQLESLDLSSNTLSGSIPTSLGSLTFLSFLNLSVNRLVGIIPSGNQMQTFSNNSFLSNPGLCGFPLTATCSKDVLPEAESSLDIDWESIYSGIGFGIGAGAVVGLLMLWHKGTQWLEDNVDKILLVALPMLGFSYKPRDEWDDDEEDEDFPAEEDHRDIEMEDIQGQFCVFCSKLDVTRKKAVHDPRCTCLSSPAMSSSSFYSFSSPSLP